MNYRKKAMLMAGALLCLNLSIYSQSISLKMSNVSVKKAMTELQTKSGYSFVYIAGDVDTDRTVSINASQLKDAVAQILKGQNVSYEIQGKNIVIKKGSQQQVTSGKRKKVTGTVKDANGEPIIGATVVEKGTTNGTVTDFDGNYTLELSESGTLAVSYIGYKSQEYSVAKIKQGQLSVVLKEDTEVMDEVVVVGYAVQKKSDLTGAVGSVKSESIENQPVTRIDQALQGRISGVQIVSSNGAPGAGATIRIRGGNSINGSNEPLYVIDGIIGAGDLNSINPADIQSIEVLKDASSTAIYGSRGANGVILITTKTGKGSNGVRLNYHGYYGIQQVSRYLDLLNGPEYVQWKNENEVYFGREEMYDTENVVNTDWQKVMYRTASMTEHNVSLNSSNDKGNFFFSLNYLNQDGVMKKTNFTRYQARFNFDQNIGKYIKVGAVMSLAYTDKDNPVMDAFGIVQLPNMSIYNEDGTFNSINPSTGYTINTVAAQKEYIQNFTTDLRGFGNIYVQITPIKNLVIKSSAGFDLNRSKQNIYQSVNLPTRVFAKSGGYAAINTSFPMTYQNENTINYSMDFAGKHRLDILGGWTAQRYQYEFLNNSASGFSNDVSLYHAIEAGDPTTKNMQSGESQWSLLSALFRVNYVLKDRYLFTISGRSDGSSRLSKDNRWEFFPSAAIAWRISEERFLKEIGWISNLKIRASYGRSGSQSINPYSTLDKLVSGQTVMGDAQAIYYTKSSIANKDLTWEKTDQVDVGANIGLWGNRVNLELDWYYKKTTDLLLYRELPYQTGFGSILENVGSVQNKGFEFSLNTVNITTKDFEWTSNLTISTNKSKVLDLAGKDFLENGTASRLIVGEPVGTFYGIKYLGTWKEGQIPEGSKWLPGDPNLLDVNEDGVITVADAMPIGNAEPKFYGGFGNTLTYKNWALNVFFDFSYGNDIYDLAASDCYGGYNTNLYGDNRNRWSSSNPNSDVPRAGSGFKYITDSYAGKGGCSYFVYDGSFLRLKNINLEYTLPQFTKVIKNLSVYGSISNLFTITKYKGYSPDVNSDGSHSTRRGFDNNVYPQARTFILGLKVGF